MVLGPSERLMIELALHTELFTQLQYHLPKALEETKARLQQRLEA